MSISHYFNRTLRGEFEIHTNSPNSDLNITSNATIGGTLSVGDLPLDNSENKIVVWNDVDKIFEYRELATFNPFDQDLNTFNEVTFDKLTLKQSAQTGSVVLETDNLDLSFFQQPSSDFDTTKTWKMSTVVNDTAETFDFRVENRSSFAGTKVNLTLDSIDQRIIDFDKRERTNGFKIGHDWSTDEMILGYGPDNNIQNGKKITLNNTGDVILSNLIITNVAQDDSETRILVLDNPTNTVAYRDASTIVAGNPFDQDLNTFNDPEFNSVNINGVTSITETSGRETTFSMLDSGSLIANYFNFDANTNTQLAIRLGNKNAGTGAHSGLLLETDITGLTNVGGNQFIGMRSRNFDGWEFGHKKSDSSFRFNWGGFNALNTDANTKLKVSNTGILSINESAAISAPSDSSFNVIQTPDITTGIKNFAFVSNSSDGIEMVTVNNNGVSPTAHTVNTLRTQLNTGNMLTRYHNNAFALWLVGYKQNDATYRWNYDITGNDYLTNDGNTKMVLDSNGNLNVTGVFKSVPVLTIGSEFYGGVSSTGVHHKIKRTACSSNNPNVTTVRTFPVVSQYEIVPAAGWVNQFNMNSDWTALGTTFTYLRAESATIVAAGSIILTGTINSDIFLGIFKNGIQQTVVHKILHNANHHLSLDITQTLNIITGDVVELKLANAINTNSVSVRSGFFNINSI